MDCDVPDTKEDFLPPKVPSISLPDLPVDVLLRIFSLLPLRSVLQLEHLSRHLHHAVSAYLATLKVLNLYHDRILEDNFRDFDQRMIPSDIQLSSLLVHCRNVSRVVLLPCSMSVEGTTAALSAHKNITQLDFCSSVSLAETIHKSFPHITIDTIHFVLQQPLYILPNCNVRKLQIEGGTIHGGIPSLPCVEEINLSNVTILFDRGQNAPKLPLLKSFSFSGKISRRDFTQQQCFDTMLVGIAVSPFLTSLRLGLENFSCLEEVKENGGLSRLKTFKLSSSGLYAAALQQKNYAGVTAELCARSAGSLEYLSLPSSILMKQFFVHFISNGIPLLELRNLQVNGIADTKLFLAPGNLVESHYYQDFLKLCPKMTSLSLHSFTGSLPRLPLPLTLSDLTLPWDNRLNLQNQQAVLYTTLSSLPNLRKLSVAGVEEVDGVMQVASQSKHLPGLTIENEKLIEFRISNVCINKLDLTGCTSLSQFVLHCCPALRKLSLPSCSMKHITIYNDTLPTFLREFASQREHAPTCHIHIQLHTVVDAHSPQGQLRNKPSLGDTASVLGTPSCHLDYCILNKADVKTFEHNSGEPMYACTDFQASEKSRSQEDIHRENSHRSLALEGIRRWLECISDFKSLANPDSHPSLATTQHRFSAMYCSYEYECCTNIPWLLEINKSPILTQPSGGRTSDDRLLQLNVPRLTSHSSSSFAQESVSNNPLVFVSVMEYIHRIHALFYCS